MTPKRIVESLLDEKPVIQRDYVVKNGTTICPHCHEEIHEKGYSERDGKTVHAKCGGVIKMPGPSEEEIAYMRQHWNLGYDGNEFQKLGESQRLEESPNIRVLKDNRRTLSPEEREAVIKAGAVWPGTRDPGVWKAVVRGETWYCSNTHRVYQADKNLKTAIKKFIDVVEQSA